MGLRINHNISAINAHRQILVVNNRLASSLEKLSSGYRINRAKDGPAGLVISEQLRAQIAGIDQAIENSQRASNIIATAEGALEEMNNLLRSMRALAVEATNSGGMDEDQIQANQDEIDSAIASIDRIANSTKFGSKKLLNGTQGYVLTGASSEIVDITVRGMQFGTASSLTISINVLSVASQALLTTNTLADQQNDSIVRISGKDGTEVFSFASGMTSAQVANAINTLSANTGVIAHLSGANYYLMSRDYGGDAFVSLEVLEGTFQLSGGGATQGTTARDYGADISATVEGMSVAASGNYISVAGTFFTGEIQLSGAAAGSTYTFGVLNTGMKFQLGSDAVPAEQASTGIPNMHSTKLGKAFAKDGNSGYLSSLKSGQSHSLAKDPDSAVEVIDYAIADVNRVRAQLGAFEKNTLETNINSQRIASENLTAAESRIRDVDFAAEIMEYTKNQILLQSGMAMLAQANFSAQTVLQLLG